jgi:hypothetical protein
MNDIDLKIIYNIGNDSFDVSGNAKDPKKIVTEFLRTQIGVGADNSKANEQEEYTILINLDLSEDVFSVSNDCGNKGLRDGILQQFISR